MAVFDDPCDIREYRKERKEEWLKKSQALTQITYDWLKVVVNDAKTGGGIGVQIIDNQPRELTKSEIKKLKGVTYTDETFWVFAQKIAKAGFDDQTREHVGSNWRREKGLWHQFLTGKPPKPIRDTEQGAEFQIKDNKNNQEAFPPLEPGLYVCTICGRVVESPNPGGKTCRQGNLHAWSLKVC